MSLAATFGFGQSPVRQSLSGDNKRWAASFAFVLALHVVATVFILRWYQNLPAPTPLPPSLTMIELAPLPAPPAPPVAAPPPPPPPPEPQVQPQEEPVPVAKPLVQPKPRPVVKHVERPRPRPQPTQTVESMAPVTAPPTPDPAGTTQRQRSRYPSLHRSDRGATRTLQALSGAGAAPRRARCCVAALHAQPRGQCLKCADRARLRPSGSR